MTPKKLDTYVLFIIEHSIIISRKKYFLFSNNNVYYRVRNKYIEYAVFFIR